MRWNKKFDGTKESLIDKSLIKLYLNTLILIQMQKYLGSKAILDVILRFLQLSYSINLKQRKNIIGILALFFVFLKNWIFLNIKKKKKKVYVPKLYDIPTKLGVKWQLDVKFIPKMLCRSIS